MDGWLVIVIIIIIMTVIFIMHDLAQVSVAVLLDNFLTASKDIKKEEEDAEYNQRRKAGPVCIYNIMI